MDQNQEPQSITEPEKDSTTTSTGETSGDERLFAASQETEPNQPQVNPAEVQRSRTSTDTGSVSLPKMSVIDGQMSTLSRQSTEINSIKNGAESIARRNEITRANTEPSTSGIAEGHTEQPVQRAAVNAYQSNDESQKIARAIKEDPKFAVSASGMNFSTLSKLEKDMSGGEKPYPTSYEKSYAPAYMSVGYTSPEKLERAQAIANVNSMESTSRAASRVSGGGTEFSQLDYSSTARRANIMQEIGTSAADSRYLSQSYPEKIAFTDKYGSPAVSGLNNYYERSDRAAYGYSSPMSTMSTAEKIKFAETGRAFDSATSAGRGMEITGSFNPRLEDKYSASLSSGMSRNADYNNVMSAMRDYDRSGKDIYGSLSAADYKQTMSASAAMRDLGTRDLAFNNSTSASRDYGLQQLLSSTGKVTPEMRETGAINRDLFASASGSRDIFQQKETRTDAPQSLDLTRAPLTGNQRTEALTQTSNRPEAAISAPLLADNRRNDNNDRDDFLRFMATPVQPTTRTEVRAAEVQQPMQPIARSLARVSLDPVVEAQALRPGAAKPEGVVAGPRTAEAGVTQLRALGLELTATARTTDVVGARVIEAGRVIEGTRATSTTGDIAAVRVMPGTRVDAAAEAALGTRVAAIASEGVRNVRTDIIATGTAGIENGVRAGRVEIAVDAAGRPIRNDGQILSVRQESPQISDAGRTIRADLGQLTDSGRPGVIRTEGVVDGSRVVRAEEPGVRVIDGRRIVEPVAPNGKPVSQTEVEVAGTRRINPTTTTSTTGNTVTTSDVIIEDGELVEDGDDSGELKGARRLTDDKRYLTGVELGLAALLIGAAAAKARDQDKEEQQQQILHRRTYMMEQGDTLQSIAEKFYQDPGLAPLIADFNLGAIKESFMDGKRIVEFKTRQLIELPEPQDIEEYRLSRKSGSADDLITIVTESTVDQELLSDFLGTVSGQAPAPKTAAAETPIEKIDPASVLPAISFTEGKSLPALLNAAKPLQALFLRNNAKEKQVV